MQNTNVKISSALSGKRRSGIIASLALTTYLFCGADSTTQGCAAPAQPVAPIISTGDIVGTIAIVAAVVVIPIVATKYHTHHNIKGCLFNGPAGLEILDTGKHKIFALAGATTNLKVGDEVHIHGDRQPKIKGSDQTFLVANLNKDYGSCTVPVTASTTPATTPAPATPPTP